MSSVASFQPAPRLAVYAATKAYVTSLSESLHEEARGTGVHVTALCPGLTKTEFQSVSNTEKYADEFPGLAWTSPELVVNTGLSDVIANNASVGAGFAVQGDHGGGQRHPPLPQAETVGSRAARRGIWFVGPMGGSFDAPPMITMRRRGMGPGCSSVTLSGRGEHGSPSRSPGGPT